MGGHDPYSSSKGAAELVAGAFLRSYDMPLASARAGNVIGGGDFSEDRLIPDIARAAMAGAAIPIRSPQAVRPWQHVLNPLAGYLELAQRLAGGEAVHGAWNFGPDPGDVQTVGWLVERLTEMWPGELRWEIDPGPHPHEAAHLALDSTKARAELGWRPAWDLAQALEAIVELVRGVRRAGMTSARSRSTRSSASLPSRRDDCDLPILRRPARDGVRRPRHVADGELLPAARPRQRHGAVLPPEGVGLRRVQARAARGVRDAGRDLQRLRVLLGVLVELAGALRALRRAHDRALRLRRLQPGRGARVQRRLPPAVLRAARRPGARHRARRERRARRGGARGPHARGVLRRRHRAPGRRAT